MIEEADAPLPYVRNVSGYEPNGKIAPVPGE